MFNRKTYLKLICATATYVIVVVPISCVLCLCAAMLLNSLRFGPLKEDRNSYLFDGVVHGISGYGNCIGVPNVGGEVNFDKSYSVNPLVNAMCLGLLKTEQLVRATAGESGESVPGMTWVKGHYRKSK